MAFEDALRAFGTYKKEQKQQGAGSFESALQAFADYRSTREAMGLPSFEEQQRRQTAQMRQQSIFGQGGINDAMKGAYDSYQSILGDGKWHSADEIARAQQQISGAYSAWQRGRQYYDEYKDLYGSDWDAVSGQWNDIGNSLAELQRGITMASNEYGQYADEADWNQKVGYARQYSGKSVEELQQRLQEISGGNDYRGGIDQTPMLTADLEEKQRILDNYSNYGTQDMDTRMRLIRERDMAQAALDSYTYHAGDAQEAAWLQDFLESGSAAYNAGVQSYGLDLNDLTPYEVVQWADDPTRTADQKAWAEDFMTGRMQQQGQVGLDEYRETARNQKVYQDLQASLTPEQKAAYDEAVEWYKQANARENRLSDDARIALDNAVSAYASIMGIEYDEADAQVKSGGKYSAWMDTQASRERLSSYAAEHPFAASALTVATQPFANIEGYTDILAGAATGQSVSSYDSGLGLYLGNQAIRQQAAQKTGEVAAKLGLDESTGQWVYNTVMSAADSAVNMALMRGATGLLGAAAMTDLGLGGFGELFGMSTLGELTGQVVSNAVMGSGAAVDSFINYRQRGYSDQQALLAGIVAGAIEGVTEAIGGERTWKAIFSGETTLSALLQQFNAEGTEEWLGNMLNDLFADMVLADPDAKKRIDDRVAVLTLGYLRSDPNMSRAEALKRAVTETMLAEDVSSYLAGGFSALISTGAGRVINAARTAVNDYQTGRAMIREGYRNAANVNTINESLRMSGKAGTVTETTGSYKLGRAVRQATQARTESNTYKAARDATPQVREALIQQGIRAEIADRAAEPMAKRAVMQILQQNGVDITEDMARTLQLTEEQEELLRRKPMQAAYEAVVGQMENASEASMDRAGGIAGTIISTLRQDQVAGKLLDKESAGQIKEGQDPAKFIQEKRAVLTAAAAMGVERREEALEKLRSNKDVMTDEQIAAIYDQAARKAEAAQIDKDGNLAVPKSASTAAVKFLKETFNAIPAEDSKAREDFSVAGLRAYNLGLNYGGSEYAASSLKNQMAVYPDIGKQIQAAYDAGLAERQGRGLAVASAATAATAEERAQRRTGRISKANVEAFRKSHRNVNRVGANGINTINEVTAKNLTREQWNMMDMSRNLSRLLNVNIVYFSSRDADENYATDEYGRMIGSNGWWDAATNTIYLDIYAGLDNGGSVAFTLAHELTHMMKTKALDHYQALANFVTDYYHENKITLEVGGRTVQRSYDDALGAMMREEGFDKAEDAQEEIVARACEDMLTNSTAIRTLAAQQPETADFIQKAIARLVRVWESVVKRISAKSASRYARNLRQSLDAVKQMQKLWDEGIVAAAMRSTATRGDGLQPGSTEAEAVDELGRGAKVETNAQGELLVAESADGSTVVYSQKTWENGGKDKLIRALQQNGHTAAEIRDTVGLVDDALDYLNILAAGYAQNMGYTALRDNLLADITTDIKRGKQVLSTLVKNGDYPVNLDVALICKKRVAYMNLMRRLIEDGIFDQVDFGGGAIAEVNAILRDEGFETACLGCFVESRRLQLQEWAETFVSEWNAEVEKRNPGASYFGFAKGVHYTEDELEAMILEYERAGKKNDQGNLNLSQGNVLSKMRKLMDREKVDMRHKLTVADLLTPEGLKELRLRDGTLFSLVLQRYGANSPKIVQEFNPYNGEIAELTFKFAELMTNKAVAGSSAYTNAVKNDAQWLAENTAGLSSEERNQRINDEAMRRYLYDIGGARMQSFSDFMIENVFDYLQIFADLSAKRDPMHGYTKEAVCLRLFGMSGAKWNGSLIAHVDRSMGKEYAGLLPAEEAKNGNGILVTVDGKQYAIAFDDFARNQRTGSFIQSIGMKDIIALQMDPRYSANVGSITIGVSDRQILAMLDSPLFRMVIPYHSSGMLPQYAALVGVDLYNDYTDFQETKVLQYYDKNGNPVEAVRNKKGEIAKPDTHFAFNAEVQRTGDARQAANNYLAWCAEMHPIYGSKGVLLGYATFKPKFSDSNDQHTDFTKHPNYYKLLEDFNTYDCITEESAVQGPVTMTLPSEANRLSDAELEAYKARLRETGIYSEREIERYAQKAQMTFKEIIDGELRNRAEYNRQQQPKWEGTVARVEQVLTENFAMTHEEREQRRAEKEAKKKAANKSKMKAARESILQDGVQGGVKLSSKTNDADYLAASLAPVFYSKLENEISNFKGEKLGAASVVSYLQGHGVKAEEIKWSGIRTFLEGKKSVSKAELQEWLRNNALNIEEQTLRDEDAVIQYTEDEKSEIEYWNNKIEKATERLDELWRTAYGEAFPVHLLEAEDIDRAVQRAMWSKRDGQKPNTWENAIRQEAGTVDFANIQLDIVSEDAENRAKAEGGGTRWSKYKLDGGSNYREILFRMPGSDYTNDAMRGHWKTSGVLAHARVQDFTSGDDPVLFVEEIQSDWHNAGREYGYTEGSEDETRKRIRLLEREEDRIYRALESQFDAIDVIIEKVQDKFQWDYAKAKNALLNRPGFFVNQQEIEQARDVLTGEEKSFVSAYLQQEAKREDLGRQIHDLQWAVPDAPFAKTYHEFVLKNLLRQAAENGYRYLAWTTGEMQEERWSSDYAEGYRIEYDQDIPKFLNKYGRQWGARVTEIGLDGLRNVTVPAIEINDEMRNSVLYEGQPKFSSKASDEDYLAAVERGDMETAQRMVDEAAKAAGYKVETYHGTTEEFSVFREYGKNEVGYHVGTRAAAAQRVEYALDGRVMRLYTNLGKTVQMPDIFGVWHGVNDYVCYVLGDEADMVDREFMLKEKKATAKYRNTEIFQRNDAFYAMKSAVQRAVAGGFRQSIVNEAIRAQREYLLSLGIDSVRYTNRYEAVGSKSYMLMHANQVKSTDPVTYDDNGNVIPLSERFNTEQDDIRYSVKQARELYQTGADFSEPMTTDEFREKIKQENDSEKYFPKGLSSEFLYAIGKKSVFTRTKLYRGIDANEFDYLVENGFLKSNSSYNFSFQQGQTLASEDAGYALSYATGFAPQEIADKHYKQGAPSYLIEFINSPDLNMAKNDVQESYTYGEIDQKFITRVFKIIYDEEAGKDYIWDITDSAKGALPEIGKGLEGLAHGEPKFYRDKTTGTILYAVQGEDGWEDGRYISAKDPTMLFSYDRITDFRPGAFQRLFGVSDDEANLEPMTVDKDGNLVPSGNTDIRFSQKEASDEEILAAAEPEAAKTPKERKELTEYKEKLREMWAAQNRREEALKEARRLLKSTDPDEINRRHALQREANRLKEQIAALRSDLLQRAKKEALRSVLSRERDAAFNAAAQRGRERLQRYRIQRDQGEAVKRYRSRIEGSVKELLQLVTENSDKRHVPDQLREPLAEFLQSINLESAQAAEGGPETKRDQDWARRFERLTSALNAERADELAGKSSANLYLPDDFYELMNQAAEAVRVFTERYGGTSVYDSDADTLRDLSKVLQILTHAVKEANQTMVNRYAEKISDLARQTMNQLRPLGVGKTMNRAEGWLNNLILWQNGTPYYVFKRFGEAGFSTFQAIMDGQGKLAAIAEKIIQDSRTMFDSSEVKEWQNEVHDVELSNNRTVRMTTAQLMSFYCLSKRQQAVGHLLGGGMKIDAFKDGRKTVDDRTDYVLGVEDIQAINGLLTDRQREVADALQRYMSTYGSDLGNEVTMRRFGYKAYGESNYFPIVSDKQNLNGTSEEEQRASLLRLLNMSHTKSLVDNANNAIVIQNIFDVFSNHMSDMAEYNALALPVLDMVRWFNYVDRTNTGTGSQIDTDTVQKSLATAFGGVDTGGGNVRLLANEYVKTFLKDLNGNNERGRDIGIGNLMGKYKRASVAANLRVAIQQPMSIARASAVLDPKWIVRGIADAARAPRETSDELSRYSNEAKWKDQGHHDIYIGRSVAQQIKNDQGFVDRAVERSMLLAEIGDKATWTALWAACRAEQQSKGLSGEALMDATAARFQEVIYSTQVMDATTTRSQSMRSNSPMNQMWTAFMAEPTLSVNLLANSYVQWRLEARRGGDTAEARKKAFRATGRVAVRAIAAYAVNALFVTLAESLMDAFRDDDDYETFVDKYIQALGENWLEELNPLSKVTVLKDVLNIFTSKYGAGDRMDLAALTSAKKSADILIETYKVHVLGQKPTETTYYGKMTLYGGIYQLLKTTSQITGVPFAGLSREIQTVWNNMLYPGLKAVGVNDIGRLKTYSEAAKNIGYPKLYDAIVDGDEKTALHLRQEMYYNGISDEDVVKGLKEQIKTHFTAGDIDREEASRLLVEYCGEEVLATGSNSLGYTLDKWEFGSDYRISARLEAAFDAEDAAAVREAVEYNRTQYYQADSAIKSAVTSYWKERYASGTSKATIRTMMMATGLYSAEDVEKKFDEWDKAIAKAESEAAQRARAEEEARRRLLGE